MKKSSVTNEATQKILKFLLYAGVSAWRNNVLPLPNADGSLRTASKAGLPDILGIYGGRRFSYWDGSTHETATGTFIGVELKKGRDKLRDTQIGFHTEARKLGAIIITAVGNTADEIFENFLIQWKQITKQR